MKKLLLIFVCLISQMLFGQTATAPTSGNGTSGDPYQITSLENLYWIAENSSRWGYYYIQTSNIDVSATSGWSGGGWSPIGNSTNKFTGSYNGDGHTIDGLYINRAGIDHEGLFGYTSAATISNLGVTNVNITSYRRVGAVVGTNGNNSTVNNCFSTGSITGSYIMGGLVGINDNSTVSNCYSTCSMSGATTIGGLMGYNNNTSTLSNCYSTGSVSGDGSLGGLLGYNWESSVNNNFWDTQTSGQSTSGGGTGKTTAEMKTNSTFIGAGWDTAIWNIGDGINNGYPYLDWQNPGGTPLPVELTLFTASFSEGKVILNWQTATEVNNYGFEIERKTKGDGWIFIGFIEGHGNSNSPKQYSFSDKNLIGGSRFSYRLKQIDNDGSYEYSEEVFVDNPTPTEFALHQNFPNPFNPSTSIKFAVPEQSFVKLEVYNSLGERITTLVAENLAAGNYSVNWNAPNLPSGVYIYSIQSGDFFESKKMILMK